MPQPFTLRTPLPPADLRFESMTHSAALNALEEMQLLMVSTKADIDTDKLLGELAEVEINLRDGKKRVISGYVTRFGMGIHRGRYFGYQATVRPWLWFLSRTSDCRIFQDKNVQEIVEAVFADHAAIAKYEFKLVRQYRKRTYCVQYRETDFNFVARLLEDEGIAWYFEHNPGGEHKLMLVDDISCHQPIAGDDSLHYYANVGQVPPDTEYVSHWNFTRTVKPGVASLTSYDFENPGLRLYVERAASRHHGEAHHEIFDYQGDYLTKDDGQQLADSRIDERQSQYERLTGQTNSHTLQVGHLFHLEGHPREDQNAEHLVTQTTIQASAQSVQSDSGPGEFQCSFTAMPSAQQFRPLRVTPKPFVQGPQTAVVVGPEGEEIFTDKYGRVKVHFFWDRFGDVHEKSSCWVRVSSPWAGKSFGFIQVPRIGQEVVVDFLEGDPDQPIVTGRVYNADQMPPWQLPANATQSGVLTRSSKGGAYTNANALRFEDKKGSEQVWLHAEKDQSIEVEHDEAHWVGHDRSKMVDHDETSEVKHDRKETIGNKDTLIVDKGGRWVTIHQKGENVDITGGRVYTVGGGLDQNTMNSGRITTVNGPDSLKVNGPASTIVNGTTTVINSGGLKNGIVGALGQTVSGGATINVGGAMQTKAGSFKFDSPGNMEFKGNQFNRTVNQANDVFLGPNTGTYIGAASSTMIAGARNTFVGIKNDAEVALALNCSIGASINSTLAAEINMGASVTVNMCAGPTLKMTMMGLQQETVDVSQAALKLMTGGGGGGGAGGAAAFGSGVLAGAAATLGIAGAIANAVAAYKDAAEFLKAAEDAGDPLSASNVLAAMAGTIVGMGPKAYLDGHAAESEAEITRAQERQAQQAAREADAMANQAQADAQAAAAAAAAGPSGTPAPGPGGGGAAPSAPGANPSAAPPSGSGPAPSGGSGPGPGSAPPAPSH